VSKKVSKAIEARQKMQKEELIEQFLKVGIVQIACEKLGIPRANYYRWIEEDEGFAQGARIALRLGREPINDLAEAKIIQGIKEGKRWAIEFWLKHNHDRYRYKPETLREIEQNAENEKDRWKIGMIVEEVRKKFGDLKMPWQTNPKTGFSDDYNIAKNIQKENSVED